MSDEISSSDREIVYAFRDSKKRVVQLGVETGSGQILLADVQLIAANILNGVQGYYTTDSEGNRSKVLVKKSKNVRGKLYLTVFPNSKKEDNLDFLPPFTF